MEPPATETRRIRRPEEHGHIPPDGHPPRAGRRRRATGCIATETDDPDPTRPGAASRWTPPRRGCRSIRPRRAPCTRRARRSRPTTAATSASAWARCPTAASSRRRRPVPSRSSSRPPTGRERRHGARATTRWPGPRPPAHARAARAPTATPGSLRPGREARRAAAARERPAHAAAPGRQAPSTRPVLRWRKLRDAKLYNVQVFRLVRQAPREGALGLPEPTTTSACPAGG